MCQELVDIENVKALKNEMLIVLCVFFEESCNLKDAKICHGFVLKDTKPIVTNADTKITNVDKENQVEQLPMYDPEYTAPVSMSECLAMFLFIILLFIGCAYLILR